MHKHSSSCNCPADYQWQSNISGPIVQVHCCNQKQKKLQSLCQAAVSRFVSSLHTHCKIGGEFSSMLWSRPYSHAIPEPTILSSGNSVHPKCILGLIIYSRWILSAKALCSQLSSCFFPLPWKAVLAWYFDSCPIQVNDWLGVSYKALMPAAQFYALRFCHSAPHTTVLCF